MDNLSHVYEMRVATNSRTFLQAFTPAQVRKLMQNLDGVTTDQLDAVFKSGYLAAILDPAARLDRLSEIQKVLGTEPGRKDKGIPAGTQTVDFSKSLSEMISEARIHFGVKSVADGRFKVKDVGKIQFQQSVFTFEEDIALDAACKRIIAADPRNHWTPAKIENIVAFASNMPSEWDHRWKLVAPGSIGTNHDSRHPKGPEIIPYIGRDKALMKYIKIETVHGKFNPEYSFLAVRVLKKKVDEE